MDNIIKPRLKLEHKKAQIITAEGKLSDRSRVFNFYDFLASLV